MLWLLPLRLVGPASSLTTCPCVTGSSAASAAAAFPCSRQPSGACGHSFQQRLRQSSDWLFRLYVALSAPCAGCGGGQALGAQCGRAGQGGEGGQGRCPAVLRIVAASPAAPSSSTADVTLCCQFPMCPPQNCAEFPWVGAAWASRHHSNRLQPGSHTRSAAAAVPSRRRRCPSLPSAACPAATAGQLHMVTRGYRGHHHARRRPLPRPEARRKRPWL